MSFFWLIVLLVFLFLAGTERRMWGSIWMDDWQYSNWGWNRPIARWKTDLEIRMEHRRSHEPEVIVVSADDHIESPDIHLETLIEKGRLTEARKYRRDMEKIAEEMNDDDSLQKYAIYGARIAKRQRELDERKAREEREELKKRDWLGFEVKEPASSGTPTGIAAAAAIESASEAPRTGAPPLWRRRTQPVPAEPETPEKEERKPEKEERPEKIDPEEYTDLITL
jgi:hypothetical protein